ncbi:hypothetical protein L6R52_34740, partial [Myxococcota bacterium]|nr:hypothetical protein [Myxococcota bacterium]
LVAALPRVPVDAARVRDRLVRLRAELDRARAALTPSELEALEGRYLSLRGAIPAEAPRATYASLVAEVAALEAELTRAVR